MKKFLLILFVAVSFSQSVSAELSREQIEQIVTAHTFIQAQDAERFRLLALRHSRSNAEEEEFQKLVKQALADCQDFIQLLGKANRTAEENEKLDNFKKLIEINNLKAISKTCTG